VKTFLYWSLVAVLGAGLFVVSVLYYNVETWQPQNFLTSLGKQWILSGDQRLFDVTERAFNLAGLDGFREGCGKWAPVGVPGTPLRPHFVTAEANTTIGEDELVVGVLNGGVASAYPLRVLAVHQVVNDRTQETPVLVYFGTTSHTAAAYRSPGENGPANFAASGFLYRQSDLLFDVETESLFHPIIGMFVAGERLGERARLLPSAVVALRDWLDLFPESRIMTTNTGQAARVYREYDLAAEPPAVGTIRRAFEGHLRRGRHTDVIALHHGWDSVSSALPAPGEWAPRQYGIEFQGAKYTVNLAEQYGSAYVIGPSGELAPSIRSVHYIFEGALHDAPQMEPGPAVPE